MKYDLFQEQQDLCVSTTVAKDTKWLAGSIRQEHDNCNTVRKKRLIKRWHCNQHKG